MERLQPTEQLNTADVSAEEYVSVYKRKERKKKTFAARLAIDVKRNTALYVVSLISIVSAIVFSYVPMFGLYMAFTKYRPANGIFGSEFVGFYQFEKFVNSPWFETTVVNTLRISLMSLLLAFPMPILFALLLNQIRCKVFRKTIQTITYLPHFISTVVMCGMIIMFLSPSTGLYGQIGRLLGYSSSELNNLMQDPEAFPWIYVLSDIWQHTGWDAIIYIAAMSSIDPELYDAAKIDGAGRLQTILKIDLPCLLPTIAIMLILRLGGLFGVGFEKVYLLQNTVNVETSETISTYLYKIGLVNANNDYSYASAIGLFNNIINLVILIAANQISKLVAKTSLF